MNEEIYSSQLKDESQNIREVTIIDSDGVTIKQVKIIQISVDEIKTREFTEYSPYKGLKKFESGDKDHFFGREQLLGELVGDLENQSLILLLGASGSGKSSVVRAGIVPWFTRKYGAKSILTFTPGQNPFKSLYACLLNNEYSIDEDEEDEIVKNSKIDTLLEVVKKLKPKDSNWLIFIDQFEQIFTRTPEEKRKLFLKSLVRLIKQQDQSVKFILTMRADFLDRFTPYPRFGKLTEKRIRLMTDMDGHELRLAIEQPAAQHGVVFEKGLVEEIIKEVQGRPGYLPLLQYTINLLWETERQRGGLEDRTLNTINYRQLGGVSGALSKHVDNIYTQLKKKGKGEAVKQIFLRLVDMAETEDSGVIGKPVSRQAYRSEFRGNVGDLSLNTIPIIWELIREINPLVGIILLRNSLHLESTLQELIDENLLVSNNPKLDEKSTVEIAHEALLTSWETLKEWVNEAHEIIVIRNRLAEDVKQWQQTQANGDLWSGSKLEKVLELREDKAFATLGGEGLNKQENHFLNVSLAQRDRELKKEKRRVVILGSLLFAVTTLLLVSVGVTWFANRQMRLANLRESAAKAKNLSSSIYGLVIAVSAAGQSLDTFGELIPAVEESLSEALYQVQEINRFAVDVQIGSNNNTSLALSPDGQYIIVGNDEGIIKLWDLQGNPMDTPFNGHTDYIEDIRFSTNGKYIVSASGDKTIRLWDLQGNQVAKLLTRHDYRVIDVAVTPDGKCIWTHYEYERWGTKYSTMRLWDLKGNPVRKSFSGDNGHRGSLSSFGFSRDGQYIVTRGQDKTIRVWDLEGNPVGKPLTEDTSIVSSLAVSPNGNYIASVSKDKTIRLWDLQGNPVGKPLTAGHRGPDPLVSFSPDGQYIVSYGSDIRIWDLQGNLVEAIPSTGYKGIIRSVAFGGDSNHLVGLDGEEDTVIVWDLSSNPTDESFGFEYDVYLIAFSPDGEYIVSADQQHTIRLWDLQGNQINKFTGHTDTVTSIAFSDDGKYIASGSNDQTMRLWDLQGNLVNSWSSEHRSEDEYTDTVTSIAFSPDGRYIVSGGGNDDKTVRVWDLEGNQMGKPFIGHEGAVLSVVFSPNGEYIASGDYHGNVIIWDLKGNQMGKNSGKRYSGMSVTFSLDSNYIFAITSDYEIKIFDLKGNPVNKSFKSSKLKYTFPARISVDGKYFIAEDLSVISIHNSRGKQIKYFANEYINSSGRGRATLSPDNILIAYRDNDEGIRILFNKPLIKACERLRKHHGLLDNGFSSTLLYLNTDVWDHAKLARKACLKHGNWSKEEKAEFLISEGQLLARRGAVSYYWWDFDKADWIKAEANFRQAKKLNPNLTIDPKKEVQKLAVPVLLNRGTIKASDSLGHLGAIRYFKEAKKLDSSLDFNPTIKAQKIRFNRHIAEAKERARQGNNIKGAISSLEKADKLNRNKKLNPDFDLESEIKAAEKLTELAKSAKPLLEKARKLRNIYDIEGALEIYFQVEKMDAQLQMMSASDWHYLCWWGSLKGMVEQVITACEKAVALEPNDGRFLDSRGLARALTGDKEGAIEDFEAYRTMLGTSTTRREQRQRWIDALRAGENPFTEEEIESLFYE